MSDVLQISDDGHVRTVRLNRPEKKNAPSQELAWGIIANVARDLARMADDGAPRPSNGTRGLSPERPLEGLVMVDLSQGRAGPHASMLTADARAHVIKVEPPEGDLLRRQGPPFIGEDAAAFVLLNHGKQGIAIDPASDDDGRLFGDLLRKADVVIEDWRSEYSRAGVRLRAAGRGEPARRLPVGDRLGRPGAVGRAPAGGTHRAIRGRDPALAGSYRRAADPHRGGYRERLLGHRWLSGAVRGAPPPRARGQRAADLRVALRLAALHTRDALDGQLRPGQLVRAAGRQLERARLPRQRAFQCRDGLVTFNPRVTDDEQLRALLEKLGVDAASVGEIPEGVITWSARRGRS